MNDKFIDPPIVFRTIVDHDLNQVLTAAGFLRIRRRMVWHRAAPELVHIMDVQSGRPGLRSAKSFTLNWAIGVPGLLPLLRGRSDPSQFDMAGGVISGRADTISGLPRSPWWTLSGRITPTDLDELIEKITADAEAIAEFLATFRLRCDIDRYLRTSQRGPRLITPSSELRKWEVLAGLAVMDARTDQNQAIEELERLESSRMDRTAPLVSLRLRSGQADGLSDENRVNRSGRT